MKVLYLGHYKEGTGWSVAAINNILALNKQDIDLVYQKCKTHQRGRSSRRNFRTREKRFTKYRCLHTACATSPFNSNNKIQKKYSILC